MTHSVRLTAGVAGLAIAGIALAGCGGAATSSAEESGADTITVGLLIPKTGVYASLGSEMKKAVDLYMKTHDNELGGKKATVEIADSASSPETGKQKAGELIQHDGADVLTGVVASPVAVSVADVAVKHKTGLVIANAGATDLTGPGVSPYVWRTSHANYQHGYAAGVYAAKHVSKTGAVFMGADYSAGTETRDGFVAGYKANGGSKLLADILTPFGKTSNYQPYLSKIPAKAEFVYAFYAGGEAVTFDKNYKKFGYNKKLPLIGAEDLTDETILGAVGESAVGVRTVGMYSSALDNAANKKFTALWAKEYDGAKPSIIAVTMWDAMQLIDKGAGTLKGGVTSDDLAKSFGEVGSFSSPRGKLTIDPKTHNPVEDYFAMKLEKKGNDTVNTVLETVPATSIESFSSES